MKLLTVFNDNPYSKPYKEVSNWLGSPPTPNRMEPTQVEGILKELFPIGSAEILQRHALAAGDGYLSLSTDEVSRGSLFQAPGPDMITNNIWEMIQQVDPSFLVDIQDY